jgi:hypothetical protein
LPADPLVGQVTMSAEFGHNLRGGLRALILTEVGLSRPSASRAAITGLVGASFAGEAKHRNDELAGTERVLFSASANLALWRHLFESLSHSTALAADAERAAWPLTAGLDPQACAAPQSFGSDDFGAWGILGNCHLQVSVKLKLRGIGVAGAGQVKWDHIDRETVFRKDVASCQKRQERRPEQRRSLTFQTFRRSELILSNGGLDPLADFPDLVSHLVAGTSEPAPRWVVITLLD